MRVQEKFFVGTIFCTWYVKYHIKRIADRKSDNKIVTVIPDTCVKWMDLLRAHKNVIYSYFINWEGRDHLYNALYY